MLWDYDEALLYFSSEYTLLIAGDDDFFLKHGFDKECAGYGNNKEENIKWMDDLKNLWRQMDGENRKKTIKYFQNLTTMSRLYNN